MKAEATDNTDRDTAVARKLAALAHPVRLRLLRDLGAADSCCVKDLVGRIGLAQSTVSQHLKVLVDAELVRFRADTRTSELASKTVSADQGNPFGTLKNLWPYMWPADRPDLKMRVLWASLFLVLSKLVLISVPYFFKWATDALNGNPDVVSWMPALIATPVMLVIAYNVVRIVQWGFNQLRDALFARVGQHAVRQLAYKTFVHMHELSLRFHLERRTGGLSRIIERGTKGIETIVRFTILNTAPTLIEFALTAVIFGLAYGWSYVLVTAVTIWLYIWFTVRASDWRIPSAGR
jgi:DNA-binding transcriptional ArsR family regulator